jgi:hypothetical protein
MLELSEIVLIFLLNAQRLAKEYALAISLVVCLIIAISDSFILNSF